MYELHKESATGFPFIRMQTGGGAFDVLFIPVTKIQFERFICEQQGVMMTGERYKAMWVRNGRVAVPDVGVENYPGCLLTNVSTEEARRFASWMRSKDQATDTIDSWRLPSDREWRAVYEAATAARPLEIGDLAAKCDERDQRIAMLMRRLLEAVALACEHNPSTSLADQMLLGRGCYEMASQYGYPNIIGRLGRAAIPLNSGPDILTSVTGEVKPSDNRGFRLWRSAPLTDARQN
jgi:hypothetical protein